MVNKIKFRKGILNMNLGAEFKSSGITENTPKNVMLGAGTVHRGLKFEKEYAIATDETFVEGVNYFTRTGTEGNYVYAKANVEVGAEVGAETYYVVTGGKWNFEESLICATSGGSKLSITPEYYDIPVDGATVKVKGLTVKTGETAQLEINLIEISPEMMKLAVLGDEIESKDIIGYNEIVSRARIEEGDYLTDMGYVGKTIEGKPIIILFENALCTSGLSFEGKNKEAATVPFTFECFADLSPEADRLPYHIYYPKTKA
jgi:hypothetical protein